MRCWGHTASTEVAQHADEVLLLYKRPGLPIVDFDRDSDWDMQWFLAKKRNGPIGKMDMVFLRTLQRYVTPEEYDEIQMGK